MLPRVAIVGRPNVGKSSLMNRLARRRVSIVDPAPGVTRDRVGTVVEIDPPLETPKGTPGRTVEVIDTGGYGVYTADGKRYDEVGADLATLTPAIEAQIVAAIEQAHVILFLTDAQSGPTALDETIARLLREHGGADGLARVVVVANKADGPEWVPHGLESARFGLGEPHCISAETGFGIRDLLDAIHARLADVEDGPSESEAEMKLAIVGRRNTGKSTLINALSGQPRVIVSEIAGTTRDAVDVRFEIDGRPFIAIDTAGVRKRKSFTDDIEYYAYRRVLQSIRRADVVLFMIDATRDVSQVDKKIGQELQRQHKPTVIVVNKVDLVDKDAVAPDDFLDYLTEQLRGLDYAPIVFISAKTGEHLRDAITMAHNLHEQASHRESTGTLNRVIESILKARGPSSRLGTQAKLYYAAQIDTNPPTIVLTVNRPELFEGQYERYIVNRLREQLPFSEVPIRLIFQTRGRKALGDMKHAGYRKDAIDAGKLVDEG